MIFTQCIQYINRKLWGVVKLSWAQKIKNHSFSTYAKFSGRKKYSFFGKFRVRTTLLCSSSLIIAVGRMFVVYYFGSLGIKLGKRPSIHQERKLPMTLWILIVQALSLQRKILTSSNLKRKVSEDKDFSKKRRDSLKGKDCLERGNLQFNTQFL